MLCSNFYKLTIKTCLPAVSLRTLIIKNKRTKICSLFYSELNCLFYLTLIIPTELIKKQIVIFLEI